MRNWSISLPILFVLFAATAVGSEAEKYEIGVTGMTWGGSCAKAVRATLSKMDNVDDVKVDFAGKKATVTMKKGSLAKRTVEAAFKNSRYGVSSFKQLVSYPRSYTISVSGMTWGIGCEKRVREALSKMAGVDKVKIDYDKKTAEITMKLGVALEQETVAVAFKKTKRYGLTSFKENKPVVKKAGHLLVGISGMTWMGCVNSVRRTLSKLDGVKEVDVDLKKKTAKVTLKERATISKETVAKAFDGTQFKVTSFEKM